MFDNSKEMIIHIGHLQFQIHIDNSKEILIYIDNSKELIIHIDNSKEMIIHIDNSKQIMIYINDIYNHTHTQQKVRRDTLEGARGRRGGQDGQSARGRRLSGLPPVLGITFSHVDVCVCLICMPYMCEL